MTYSKLFECPSARRKAQKGATTLYLNMAFKVDPDTYQVQLTVTGLVNPYTYSDMTGAGLDLVLNPPG